MASDPLIQASFVATAVYISDDSAPFPRFKYVKRPDTITRINAIIIEAFSSRPSEDLKKDSFLKDFHALYPTFDEFLAADGAAHPQYSDQTGRIKQKLKSVMIPLIKEAFPALKDEKNIEDMALGLLLNPSEELRLRSEQVVKNILFGDIPHLTEEEKNKLIALRERAIKSGSVMEKPQLFCIEHVYGDLFANHANGLERKHSKHKITYSKSQ